MTAWVPNTPGATCTTSGDRIECNLPFLAESGTINTIVEVQAPAAEGAITNQASVESDMFDSVTANNSDSEETCVQTVGNAICASDNPPTDPPTDPPSNGSTDRAGLGRRRSRRG